MKLLRKIALTICIMAMSFVLPSTVFADSTITLTGGSAGPVVGGNPTSVTVSLTPLLPFVTYTVSCPLSVSGASSASIFISLGIHCPTLGPCCKFSRPCLSNLGNVGSKNGSGAYQAVVNANGSTTYTNNSVSQINTGDNLTFTNLDSAATLIVGSCTATPTSSNCCNMH